MRGVPIDRHMNYVGSFWDLLSPYALLGGISLTLMCLLHGALFITLRFTGDMQHRARQAAKSIGVWTTIGMFLFVIYSYFETDIFIKVGFDPGAYLSLPHCLFCLYPFLSIQNTMVGRSSLVHLLLPFL